MFKQLSPDLANVNAWQNMCDPYIQAVHGSCCTLIAESCGGTAVEGWQVRVGEERPVCVKDSDVSMTLKTIEEWVEIQFFCGSCLLWVHKKCSGTKGPPVVPKGPLRPDPEFRCTQCMGNVGMLKTDDVLVVDNKLEVIPGFCYLRACCYSYLPEAAVS